MVGGAELADLVVKMVAALNSRDIPTAGSILEHFNRELVTKLRDAYAAALEAVDLPVPEEKLDIAAMLAHTDALDRCTTSLHLPVLVTWSFSLAPLQ